MTFEEAVPVVEGKLYAYGAMKLEYPQAAVSPAYEDVPPEHRPTSGGPQERWAVRHWREIQDAAAIERVLRILSERERDLIRLRYFERWPWRQVAQKLYVSERAAFEIRDRVLALLAYEFGLLGEAGLDEEAS